jgi:hypothetical protein
MKRRDRRLSSPRGFKLPGQLIATRDAHAARGDDAPVPRITPGQFGETLDLIEGHAQIEQRRKRRDGGAFRHQVPEIRRHSQQCARQKPQRDAAAHHWIIARHELRLQRANELKKLPAQPFPRVFARRKGQWEVLAHFGRAKVRVRQQRETQRVIPKEQHFANAIEQRADGCRVSAATFPPGRHHVLHHPIQRLESEQSHRGRWLQPTARCDRVVATVQPLKSQAARGEIEGDAQAELG